MSMPLARFVTKLPNYLIKCIKKNETSCSTINYNSLCWANAWILSHKLLLHRHIQVSASLTWSSYSYCGTTGTDVSSCLIDITSGHSGLEISCLKTKPFFKFMNSWPHNYAYRNFTYFRNLYLFSDFTDITHFLWYCTFKPTHTHSLICKTCFVIIEFDTNPWLVILSKVWHIVLH